MGLFDFLKSKAKSEAKQSIKESVRESEQNRKREEGTVRFEFSSLPKNLDELKALSEASMDTPYKTAALTILALCVYADNKDEGIKCLNYLRGPAGNLNPSQIQFFDDRFKADNGKLVPYSYFKGATPENDYAPAKPYKLEFFTNSHSYEQDTYCKLHMYSGGADSERQVLLRVASGKWYLWEQYVMVGIKVPKSQNPWG
jgi:hypothetical protein